MSHGCDRVRIKTLSRKFDKWECIWCGQKQTVKKGEPPKDECARMLNFKDLKEPDNEDRN
jgi:hypothetical protein